MNSLQIDLENCTGIGKLKHEFQFSATNTNTFLIYAPNGTMKTSFATPFDQISKNDPKNKSCGRIFPHKIPKFDVIIDGLAINPEMFRAYKRKYPNSGAIELIEKVNLMAPENIHINAFMHEPLIDMSVFHLIDLYKNISSLKCLRTIS